MWYYYKLQRHCIDIVLIMQCLGTTISDTGTGSQGCIQYPPLEKWSGHEWAETRNFYKFRATENAGA